MTPFAAPQPAVTPRPPARPLPTTARAGSPGLHFAAAVLLVLAVAAGLRAVGIDTWSLWEDEEGSLTRAHESLFWGFQKFFPLFFFVLKPYTDWVGLSVGALRALPAALGVLSIAFTMTGFRRHVSARTAVVAGLLLAVNLGHLFFSQTVRYYTTVLTFEVLAAVWFFDGFETGRRWKLGLSLAMLVLGLLTHFSALLLAPVFVGHLLLAAVLRDRGGGYTVRWYLIYGAVLVVVGAVFAWRMTQLQGMIGGWAIPSQRDPYHVGTTIVAYFGLPILVLGLLAPWLARDLPGRTLRFLLVLAVVPVLELLTLAALNTVNVTWYYGFIGMIGFAVLAAATLTSQWRLGRKRLVYGLGAAAALYSAAFLGMYYTIAHGDRPRWAEAAEVLKAEAGVRPGNPDNPMVRATVPGTLAFYLGEHPSKPEKDRIVMLFAAERADVPAADWYVVEDRVLSPQHREWFAERCELRARFEAHSGPVDRSVSVYRTRPAAPGR